MFATPLIVPPLTSTAQGNVSPEKVTCQAPPVSVVVEKGLPAAQITLMFPPTIGVPTAAIPLIVPLVPVLAAGVLPPLLLLHEVIKTATKKINTIPNKHLMLFIHSSFLRLIMHILPLFFLEYKCPFQFN